MGHVYYLWKKREGAGLEARLGEFARKAWDRVARI
jgi:hypothetical protein